MLIGCAGMKSAFLINRREAPHFLEICQVFLTKKWGIFIKEDLKVSENRGWRIREAIH